MDNYEKIITDTFEQPFNPDQFDYFVRNLLNGMEPRKDQLPLPKSDQFQAFIKSYKRIGKYVVDDCNSYSIIDVLIVKLKNSTSVEKARTAQRNLIARYLNSAMDVQRDAALVAFVSDDNPDWRFSLVWMDPKRQGNSFILEPSPAKRYSFLVGPNEKSFTAKSQLKKCFNKDKVTLDDLVEAFSIEKVGQEFYDKYEDLYLELKKELDRLYDADPVIKKDFDNNKISRIDFAKKTLGQLVFLYFLQKKGWLGVKAGEAWGAGDKKFLRNLYEGKEYKKYDNFFNEILEPLFYKALREDRRDKKDFFDDLNCRIPFLNGGLFDPINDYDWQKTNITIDNEIFEKVFDVFDLYNFTVKEDEPLEKEVAVDPEMLGKVFEELLEVTERKSKGAFYTPREIVHYMCQESLVNYLATEFEGKVPKEDFETLIEVAESTYQNKRKRNGIDLPESVKKHAQPIDDALKDIKICDPAIGSGAFPVGMMNEIVRLRTALNEELHEEGRTAYNFKRQVIENNIYGVDIEPGAIEVARLRFWLSLVVDEEKLEDIEPLPNLDYKIMQGNSLISSYEDVDFDELFTIKEKNIQRGLFTNNIQTQFDNLVEKLKKAKNEYLKTPHKEEKRELRDKIEKLIQDIILNKLEEKYTKDNVKGKAKAKEFSDVLIQMKEKKEFFPWKLWFAEVFEQKGGFDIVIGNPPYFIVFDEKFKKILENNFNTFKKNNNIYVAFYEKGMSLLKDFGVITLITPNTFLNGDYFKKLREFLIENSTLKEITDYKNIEIFEDPTVFVSVFIAQRHKTINFPYKYNLKIAESDSINDLTLYDGMVLYKSDEAFKPQNEILGKLLLRKDIQILDKDFYIKDVGFNYWSEGKGKKRDGNSIGDRVFYSGIKENNNDIPFLKGRDLHKYFVLQPSNYLKYNYKEFLNKEDTFRYSEDFLKISPKIIYRQTANRIIATIDYDSNYLDKTVHLIVNKQNKSIDLKFLLAVLNSTLFNYLYLYISQEIPGKAFSQVKTTYIKKLPLKIINKEVQQPFIKKVDKILEITKTEDYKENSEKQAKVKDYEKEIDLMVYKLYDLDYEEVKVIDPEFWLSEEQYIAYKCGESQECIALATTQEKSVAKTSESITTLKNFEFDKRPSTKAIIEKISEHNPDLLDNDRAFTEVFKSIAFKNGYSKQDIPKYWTIGRQIFDYKKEKGIKASPNADKRVAITYQVNFDDKILSNFVFVKEDGKKYKPSIKEIIQRIVEYKPEYTENDWDILELFDAVALNNGYDEDSLPKYWNIIRAVYDLKKNVKPEEFISGQK